MISTLTLFYVFYLSGGSQKLALDNNTDTFDVVIFSGGSQKLALGHRHPISCVSLSPSGQFLATGEEVAPFTSMF